MSLTIITPPVSILDLDDVRRQLGTSDDPDEDLVIDALARAAQAEIEPPSWVGRSFGMQTLEVRLPDSTWLTPCSWSSWGYWAAEIALPYPPLVSIVSVKYLDTDGDEQTLDPATYEVLGAGSTGSGKIVLANGQSWPSTLCHQEAIRVRFTAGYELTDPQLRPVQQALMLSIGQFKSLSKEDLLLTRENVPGVGTQEWALSSDASGIIQKTMDRLLMKSWMPSLG